MANDPFYGARLKVERANHHIEELERVFRAHLEASTKRTEPDKIERIGNHVSVETVIMLKDPMPKHAGTIIGDVLHNLRVALDHAYWALVEANGGTWKSNVKFPIFPTRPEAESTLAGYPDREKPEVRVLDFIFGKLEPFDGGRLNLYDLHRLDIIDKHKLLVPTLTVTPFADDRLVRVEAIDEGAVQIRAHSKGGVRITPGGGDDFLKLHEGPIENIDDMQKAISILFDEGPMQDSPVFDTLRLFSKHVSGALDALEVFL